jgi:hypothetical protein
MARARAQTTMRAPVVTPVDRMEHVTIAGMRMTLGPCEGRHLRSVDNRRPRLAHWLGARRGRPRFILAF